jgi:hypothetical protein
MPTHKGSNMSDSQYAHPGEMTNEKSHALFAGEGSTLNRGLELTALMLKSTLMTKA